MSLFVTRGTAVKSFSTVLFTSLVSQKVTWRGVRRNRAWRGVRRDRRDIRDRRNRRDRRA